GIQYAASSRKLSTYSSLPLDILTCTIQLDDLAKSGFSYLINDSIYEENSKKEQHLEAKVDKVYSFFLFLFLS
ncbi:hypothetical protein PJP10_32185, partial [Mycobacterium kansasii]